MTEEAPLRTLALTQALRSKHSDKDIDIPRYVPARYALMCAFGDGSLKTWRSFLEWSNLVLPDHVHPLYECFGFELLHNCHLGVSKTLKEVYLEYVSNKTFPSDERIRVGSRTLYIRLANDYLAEVDLFFPIPDVRVDFSSQKLDGREDGF